MYHTSLLLNTEKLQEFNRDINWKFDLKETESDKYVETINLIRNLQKDVKYWKIKYNIKYSKYKYLYIYLYSCQVSPSLML